MKIGIVCYPSLGGSGILATSLGQQLAQRGHSVHFITYDMPFALDEKQPGIYLHRVEIHPYELFKYPDYNLALAVKIAQVSKRENLDILHVHYAIPHATSAFLAKQILGTQPPATVTTLHGTDITLVGQQPAYHDLIKFSIEQASGVTAVSEFLRLATAECFGIDREIAVIPNFFVPDPKLQGKSREGNEKVLIHVSNFRPLKRVHDVIRIFEGISKQLPARLLLVGGGGCIEEVRDDVERCGLKDRVNFLGVQRRVDAILTSADLLLLPSEQESFGMAALEAMSYGVPVVSSDAGGLPELIEDGVSGMLSPVQSVEEMTLKALALLRDRSAYAAMSRAAKARAKNLFSAERIVPMYEAYYASVA